MAGQVKLVVDADMAKGYAAFAKLVQETGKAEKGMDKLTAAGNRAERAQSAGTNKLVARVQAQTRASDLALSQAERAGLKAGFNPGGGAMGTAIERRLLAQDLRDQRSMERFVRNETVARTSRAAGSAYMMDAVLGRGGAALAGAVASREASAAARTAAETTSTFNAGSVVAFGAYGRGTGESGIEARARADVARNVGVTRELAGRVSPEDLEQMTSRRVQQLTAQKTFRNNMAGGALAVGAAAAGVIAAAEQELGKYSETLVRSEDQLATLYGVDRNPASRARLRAGAIGTSIGSGLDLGQVGELQGRLASTFGDLPADVNQAATQAALRLTKIGGRDVTSSAIGLGAGYMAYGKQLGGGADAMNVLTNQLVRGADIGGFDVDKVTPHLAAVFNAFKLAGYSPGEATGAMTLVSKSGMDPESYMTGLRNIPLMMMKGEAKGKVKRTGSFLGDVEAMGHMSGAQLTQLYGKENVGVATMMKDNQDQLKAYVDELSKMTASMDVLGQKISAMYSDQMFPTVETIKSAKQVQANAPLIQAESPMLQNAVSEWEIRKAGADVGTSPAMSWFKTPSVWMETLGSKMLGGSDMGQHFDLGLAHMIGAAEQTGDVSKASYLKLRYGQSTGSYYQGKDENGAQIYTGEAEADELMKLRAQGYNMNAQGYLKYKGVQSTNPGEADLQLEELAAGHKFGTFGTGTGVRESGRDELAGLKMIAPMLVEASRNHITAAGILSGGARDSNTHVD